MPRVTQYIRDEDFEAWSKITNKSEFIHNALNPLEKLNHKVHDLNYIDEDLKPIKVVDGVGNSWNTKEAVVKLCKHGADPKFCKFAKGGKCK